MIKISLKFSIALTVLFFLAITIGCGVPLNVGEMQNDKTKIESGDVKSVEVKIEMGVGRLFISGGSENLLDAEFNYNVAEWKPIVEYHEDGDIGTLTIKQPGTDSINVMGKAKNEWILKLNDDIPMVINCDLGVGQSNLDLGTLKLKSLDLDTGVGEVTLDLKGSSIADLNVDSGVGELTVDLASDRQNNLAANIDSGVGELTVKLPSCENINIKAEKGIGAINAKGFLKDGNRYIHEVGENVSMMEFDIDAGIGAINLKLVDVPLTDIEDEDTENTTENPVDELDEENVEQ